MGDFLIGYFNIYDTRSELGLASPVCSAASLTFLWQVSFPDGTLNYTSDWLHRSNRNRWDETSVLFMAPEPGLAS